MSFDFGAALNTATRAYTADKQGQILRGQYDQEQARKDAEIQRQIQQNAAQNLLRQAEITHYNAESNALAHPRPETAVQVQPDGSVVLIDKATGQIIPTAAKGKPDKGTLTPWAAAGFPDAQSYLDFRKKLATANQPPQRPGPEAEQARQKRIEEGLAILGSTPKTANDPIHGAFGSAFRSVRAQNPTMHPGEAAYYAWEAIQKTRPDLVPAPSHAPSPFDAWLSQGAAPGTPGSPPTSAAQPRQPLTDTEKQTARTDPGFATWLKANKGYTDQDWQQ